MIFSLLASPPCNNRPTGEIYSESIIIKIIIIIIIIIIIANLAL